MNPVKNCKFKLIKANYYFIIIVYLSIIGPQRFGKYVANIYMKETIAFILSCS